MKYLALINARKGSKGIKNKNKKILNNKPLISWTFEIIKKLENKFEDILLSTDDNDIIKIAKKYNIDSPFVRPKSLAKDKTLQIDVIHHALNYAEKKKKYDAVVLFQPTNPLRRINDIKKCISVFEKYNPDNVITIIKSKKNLLSTLYEKNKNYLSPIFSSPERGTIRQNNKGFYSRVGSLYIIKSELVRKKKLFGDKIMGVEVSLLDSFDIDEPEDWKLISILQKYKNE